MRAEPIRKKLRRWILGEKNLPLQSITEQKISPVVPQTLTETQIKQLGAVFREMDEQLHFGFGFKYLARIYKALGVTMTDKERNEFLRKTGYFRKLNQDSAGIPLAIFLEDLATRVSLKSEEERAAFIVQFIQKMRELFPKVASKAAAVGAQILQASKRSRNFERSLQARQA